MASTTNSSESSRRDYRAAGCGLLWLGGAVMFWLSTLGNPLHSFRLITRAQVAPGEIVEAWEDAEDGERGGPMWFHTAVYSFRLQDGRTIPGRIHASGRLRPEIADAVMPIPIEVEYDPDDPSVSRIRGDGSTGLAEWAWREIGLGGFLLLVIALPGLSMLRNGLRNHPSR